MADTLHFGTITEEMALERALQLKGHAEYRKLPQAQREKWCTTVDDVPVVTQAELDESREFDPRMTAEIDPSYFAEA